MESILTPLLGLAWGIPLALCLLWALPSGHRLGERLVPWSALPALLLALLSGGIDGSGTGLTLPLLFTGAEFSLDPLGRAFLLFTALLWLAGGWFAAAYHRKDPRSGAFFLFFALTMTGNLGLVLAADLLTFYLFFALMTFAAYGLVAHARDRPARRAGRIYIVMAVLGELALLSGLLSLGAALGGVPTFGAEIEGSWRLLEGGDASGLSLLATGVLLAIGLGVKAGIVPLHLWLPLAHPVAPTAASALLSGAMIKAGLLGWVRVLPEETALPVLAMGFLGVGVFTAFYGVLMGVPQDDPKTVLAYSSVSQMGYMAIGVALLVHDPALAPLALAAIALYAMHHGLAKGALFLSVGLADRAPRAAGSPDDPWRRRILVGAALPALALAGLPLTSGGLAKNALKDGLGELGGVHYAVVDPLLLVAAFGTTLLMVRFLVTLERRRRDSLADAGAEGSEGAGFGGLLFPWAGLIGIGLVGVAWMGIYTPITGDAALPGLFDGWLAGLAPVLLGGLAGFAVLRRGEWLGSFRSVRIPAGDLLRPIEWGIQRLPRPDQEAIVERLEALGGRGTGWVVRAFDPVIALADRDLKSIRGAPLAVLVFGLALALVVLLLR
ncbi:MAG: NADH/ubiquinone/plastoquinone (complex I) [Gemmatimonadales bacterium]|nr:MAG: NADH/ubiquinone/plastoquinone (complex I) [Gemmatimonadales bacterium]